jgi:integrase/recombinase XerD
MNNNDNNYLMQYTQYMESQNKSTNTIKSYIKDITAFFKYFNTNPTTLTRDQITQYRDYLLNTKNIDAKSINRALSSLKSFNEFMVKENHQDSLVVLSVDYIKVQKSFTSPTNVSLKDTIKFINKIKEKEPYRNYAIVTLIANTGLRISEALNIKINEVDFNGDELIIFGKGNKQRTIILNPTAVGVIREYIINHRCKSNYADKCEYLFISNKGGKLEPTTINKIFNKYSKKITPHQLRHCYASSVLEEEVLNIRELQQQLGHSRLDTVMVYTHPTKEKMKSKLNKFSIG